MCESISQPRSQALSWDTPISLEEINNIKGEMMKVHTIIITNMSESARQRIDLNRRDAYDIEDKPDNNDEETDASKDLKDCRNGASSDTNDLDVASSPKWDYSSNPAYKLLSGRERLNLPVVSTNKHLMSQDKKIHQAEEEDIDEPYVVPDASQCEEIMKSVYNFDKEPVFIPDDVKNREYKRQNDDDAPGTKKLKTSKDSVVESDCKTNEAYEEHVDLETMLGTFVDKLIDE